MRRTVRAAREMGISVLTLFAFSEQNWQRPGAEIQALMELLIEYLRSERAEIMNNGIRLIAIGDLSRLPNAVRDVLEELCSASRGNQTMKLALALSYGGREDITSACQCLAQEVSQGRIRPDDITLATLDARLATHELGDVDLLIRTSGEQRISNFLLWSLAYAELWFTPKLWPDFERSDLEQALTDYETRERRFGLTRGQLC